MLMAKHFQHSMFLHFFFLTVLCNLRIVLSCTHLLPWLFPGKVQCVARAEWPLTRILRQQAAVCSDLCLAIRGWHGATSSLLVPPAVISLPESSLTNPEGYLIPASQGHSRGVGSDSGSDSSHSSFLLVINPIAFVLTSWLFVNIMCSAIFLYQGCLWCVAGRFGFVFQL